METDRDKLTRKGQHRAAGVVDLLLCATAVHHGSTLLHRDDDFATVARVLKEVAQQDVRHPGR
ncbi:PIN domain-containing protein [Streptomyces sp. NK15101]|uniref:PIN domain-containing protein n=1 Tax=Streptomyces sp. NK15101 TaxID=2873261 RepID=UPI001CEDBD23|nr:PIN domain-containing protein [Streptomyces sp. NK15101]